MVEVRRFEDSLAFHVYIDYPNARSASRWIGTASKLERRLKDCKELDKGLSLMTNDAI